MNEQNNTRLTRGLSALIVLASALWGMAPAAPGAPQKLAPLPAERAAQATGIGVTAVEAGEAHTCAIKSGALYCWGNNNYDGQLGDGTTTNRSTPVEVQGMGSSVTAVAAGAAHTCAIKSGALYCWGWNLYGQLGDGTRTTQIGRASCRERVSDYV